MTESDSSIMTTDDGIDMNTNVMIDNSTDIMTGNSQPLTRIIGKPKQDKDPNALKIASFRTKEGVWAEFSSKAESDGLTATDVLKAAMEQYISGEYNPRVITAVSMPVRHTNNSMTRNDVLDIVNTAVSTDMIESNIMTIISTLPLLSIDEFNTERVELNSKIWTERERLDLVNRELASLKAEIEALKKLDAIG